MFARLILALLLAAFALPALANGPCHDAPTVMTTATNMPHATRHGMPQREDHAVVPHVCIGCIPPASLALHAVGVPRLPAGMTRRIMAVAFDPASGTPPALPPPRSKA